MSFRKLRRKFSVKYHIPHCKHNADYMVDKSQINLSGIKRSCLFITARNSRCSVDQGLFVARGLLHLLFRVLRILRTVMDCSGCPNFWVGANRTDTWFQYVGRSCPVSSIYIWSEIFRSPSEAQYGGHEGPELRRFQFPHAVFHVYVLRKKRTGGLKPT